MFYLFNGFEFLLEVHWTLDLVIKVKWLDMKWAVRSRRIDESGE